MARLKFVKSENLDDWYLIEKAEHEGKTGLVKTEYGFALFSSARISDADVEGTAEEMLGIAEAIEMRGEYSAKRCEVVMRGDEAYFSSPRNSMEPGVVSLEDADDLARQIRETLAQ